MFNFISDLISLALAVFWGYALFVDISRGNIIWTLVDFFIAPVGMIRGFILLLN